MSTFDLLNAPPATTVASVALSRLRLAQGLLNKAAEGKPILLMSPDWQKAFNGLNALIAQSEHEIKVETKKQNALVQ